MSRRRPGGGLTISGSSRSLYAASLVDVALAAFAVTYVLRGGPWWLLLFAAALAVAAVWSYRRSRYYRQAAVFYGAMTADEVER